MQIHFLPERWAFEAPNKLKPFLTEGMKSTFENKEEVFSVRKKTAEGWSNERSYSLVLTDEVQATGHVFASEKWREAFLSDT